MTAPVLTRLIGSALQMGISSLDLKKKKACFCHVAYVTSGVNFRFLCNSIYMLSLFVNLYIFMN